MGDLQTRYKILTWNILENHDYETRIYKVAEFIKQSGATIALLQETNDDYSSQTIQAFEQIGYVVRLQPGDKRAGDISGIGIAYDPHFFLETTTTKHLSGQFRAMSLDLIPVNKDPQAKRPTKYVSVSNHQYESPLDYGNDVLTVISYHGHWGAFAQSKRFQQAEFINDFASSKGNAVILGGDFNAMPTEPAIQYLRGDLIVNERSTYWVESQDLIQQLGGPAPYGTSFAHGQIIDSQPRFDLHRTPERRIDYLFNYGFSYGREYAFDGWHHALDIDRARSLSDHAPLIAGLLDY